MRDPVDICLSDYAAAEALGQLDRDLLRAADEPHVRTGWMEVPDQVLRRSRHKQCGEQRQRTRRAVEDAGHAAQ